MNPLIHISPTADDTIRAAAERLAALAIQSIQQRARFSLALAGGSTPRALYSLLAADYQRSIDWPKVHVWWSDERCVPRDHPDSNTRMARESLLSRVPIPETNIHTIRTDLGSHRAADDYEQQLRTFDSTTPLDLTLLGLGTDGHTASLFPGGPALSEHRRWVVSAEAPPASPIKDRVTFTFPLIATSPWVMFLVAGSEKRPMIERILGAHSANSAAEPPLPSQLVRAQTPVEWFLDEPAAGSLRS